MRKINYILILFLIYSCTKEIDILIPNQGSQFVVNGYIENNQPAKILLTRSMPYFDPINYNSIIESLVNDATVKISSSMGESEELSPIFSPFLLNNHLTDTWYYNYSGFEILGEEGVTYTLEIIKNDTLVSAITTIPNLAPLTKDSLRFLYRADDSTYCYLLGHWEDPDTIGNCIRAFTQTKPIWGSVFDNVNQDSWDDLFISMLEGDGNYNDEYVNGWDFAFPMYKGRGFWQGWGEQEWDEQEYSESVDINVDRVTVDMEIEEHNTHLEVDGVSGATTGFWNIGDSVCVKWSSVDRASWDFWYSLQFNNPTGPFGAPSDANSNINGGLGVFGGTSSEYFYLEANPELGSQISSQ